MKNLLRHRRFRAALIAAVAALPMGLVGVGGLDTAPTASAQTAASPNALTNDGSIALTSEQSSVNRQITQTVERMEMLVNSNRILTLENRIPRFQIHNDTILSAKPLSEKQIRLFAKAPGTTQINLWDTDETLYTVEVTVNMDAREVEGILASQLPFATLKVLPVGSAAIVSGSVTSVDDVERAVAIAEQFYPTIVNNIKVVGVQQVLLHTRIMEVSRTKLRALGIDWGYFNADHVFISGPSGLINTATSAASGQLVASGLPSTNAFNAGGNGDFRAFVDALRQQNLIKFLAEPTVVATHGRPARFNVGGRVPYITPGGNGSVTIGYEEYGTAVDFLPFVVGPGRVRLEVRPEVTEPDSSRSINSSGINVTAFSQRVLETSVEMQAGQTFALAGLLQTRTDATSRSTPILGEMPIIGSLFRRVEHKRNDIELLITVTPELVAAMDPHEVPIGGPGLNSMAPNDHELYSSGYLEVPNLNAVACSCPPNAHGNNNTAGCAPGQNAGVVPGMEPVIVGDGVTLSTPPPPQTYFNNPDLNSPDFNSPAPFSPGSTMIEGY